ncbi:hypothetical protein WR25_24717 [Diploscapter pachys]|uniref:PARP-type domain-containing protein n=1 Tax=Diploscapter pachys TaxID=2018661 RepID=A0A2A2L9C0_9BILA|nr:hypothetical protein WR25_24717 [Diploscapter pachys]
MSQGGSDSKIRFTIDVSKRVSKCQKCKNSMEKGSLRIAKVVPNFWVAQKRDAKGEGGEDKTVPDMKQFHHTNCIFEVMMGARLTTKVIESSDDLEGWDEIPKEDQKPIQKLIDDLVEHREKRAAGDGSGTKKNTAAKRKPEPESDENEAAATRSPEKKKQQKQEKDEGIPPKSKKAKKEKNGDEERETSKTPEKKPKKEKEGKKKSQEKEESSDDFDIEDLKSNGFAEFIRLCVEIGKENTNAKKTKIIKNLISEEGYDGDIVQILSMLLVNKSDGLSRIDDKKLIHYFCETCEWDEEELMKKLDEEKDVSKVIVEKLQSDGLAPRTPEKWSVHKVHRWLVKFDDARSKDEPTENLLKFVIKRLSTKEMKYVVRLIRKDLDIGATTEVVLGAFGENAVKDYVGKGVSLDKIVANYYNDQHRLNSYSVEQAMSLAWERAIVRPSTMFKKVVVGFNCNVDLIVPGVHLVDLLNTTVAKDQDHENIQSLEDLHETFAHFFKRGAAAERHLILRHFEIKKSNEN